MRAKVEAPPTPSHTGGWEFGVIKVLALSGTAPEPAISQYQRETGEAPNSSADSREFQGYGGAAAGKHSHCGQARCSPHGEVEEARRCLRCTEADAKEVAARADSEGARDIVIWGASKRSACGGRRTSMSRHDRLQRWARALYIRPLRDGSRQQKAPRDLIRQ